MASNESVPVWIDSWQLECCGSPLAVGDLVRWTVVASDLSFLRPVLGRHWPEWSRELPLISDLPGSNVELRGSGDLVVAVPNDPPRATRLVGMVKAESHSDVPRGCPTTTGRVRRLRGVGGDSVDPVELDLTDPRSDGAGFLGFLVDLSVGLGR